MGRWPCRHLANRFQQSFYRAGRVSRGGYSFRSDTKADESSRPIVWPRSVENVSFAYKPGVNAGRYQFRAEPGQGSRDLWHDRIGKGKKRQLPESSAVYDPQQGRVLADGRARSPRTGNGCLPAADRHSPIRRVSFFQHGGARISAFGKSGGPSRAKCASRSRAAGTNLSRSCRTAITRCWVNTEWTSGWLKRQPWVWRSIDLKPQILILETPKPRSIRERRIKLSRPLARQWRPERALVGGPTVEFAAARA